MVFSLLHKSVVLADTVMSIQTGFFTSVQVENENEEDIRNIKDVKRGAAVVLKYKYKIPVGGYNTGTTYTFWVPKEIYIEDNTKFPILMEGTEVAQATVSYNEIEQKNEVKLIFSNAEAVQAGMEGEMWIGGTLSKERIPNEGKAEIDFELGLPDDLDEFIIDFAIDKQSAELSVVNQAKEPDFKNLTVPWEVTFKVEKATPANLPVTGIVISETLPEGLNFDSTKADSYKCVKAGDGAGTPIGGEISYDPQNRTISYKFPNDKEAKLGESYTLTLNTTFGLDIFRDKNTVKFESEAKADYEYVEEPFIKGENGDSTSNDNVVKKSTQSSKANVELAGRLLDKTGALEPGGAREINWTVTVNERGFGIENAKAEDTVPQGLVIDESSIKVLDENESDITSTLKQNITVNENILTVNFGKIEAKRTIKYTTKVADEFYNQNNNKTFKNNVTFTGGPAPGISVSKEASVAVGNAFVAKSGSYNRKDHTITWNITINQYHSQLKDVTVTDVIPAGLTIVTKGKDFVQEEDIKIVTQGESTNADFKYNTQERKLIANIKGDVAEKIVFQFKTTVDDPNIWAVNGYKSNPFVNNAMFKSDAGEFEVSSNPEIVSHMFEKTALSYDSSTCEIEWQIVCNQNEMPFHNGYVEDIISEGQEYVEGSLVSKASANAQVSTSYDAKSKMLKITYPSEITEQYTVTFRTKITDEDFLTSNMVKTFKNKATLYGDELPAPIESEAEKEVTGSVIQKTGKVKKDAAGINYLEWSVVINKNQAKLLKPVIVDELSVDPKLELDPSSIKLYKAKVKKDGTVENNGEVPINRENVTYSLSDNVFKYHFPSEIQETYVLVFRTDFGNDAKNKEVQNRVYYEGSEADTQSSDTQVQLSSSIAGGSTSIQKRNVKVLKYADDRKTVLEGAVFEIYNDYLTYTMKPTDENGISELENLRVGTYNIRETVAPVGYVLDDTVNTIKVENNDDTRYEALNKPVKGKIDIIINDKKGNLLNGVKVWIYDKTDKFIAEIISDKDGKVTLEDVEYGEYYYKIAEVPEGYEVEDKPYYFNIEENGQVITEVVSLTDVPQDEEKNDDNESEEGSSTDIPQDEEKNDDSESDEKDKKPAEESLEKSGPETGDTLGDVVVYLFLMASVVLCIFGIRFFKVK